LSISPLKPALDYIKEHSTEIPGMNAMAQLCHLSPSYFSRLFTRELGMNFTTYLNRHKVYLAKHLLLGTSMSVGDISEHLGFSDTSYFIKVFKRYAGMTPLAFRKRLDKAEID